MRTFHRPEVEKRMVVVLDDEDCDVWLDPHLASPQTLLRCYPPDRLTASAGR